MKHLAKRALALSFVLLALTAYGQTADSEKQAAERALLDYVEGFYEGDTAKLIRSIIPEVQKYGYWKSKKTGEYKGEAMSFREMLDYANEVKTKNQFPAATAPKKVELYEIQDQTASGKVTAWWGTDYILLAKYGGVWKIVHVLWQGPLKKD